MEKFDFNTMEEFDKHISSSIPAFKELQEFIVSLSTFFVKDASTVLDLGCSTGSLLVKLWKKNNMASYYGYDIAPNIIQQLDQLPVGVELILQDITELNPKGEIGFAASKILPTYDLALLIFVLQFLPPSSRLPLLSNLRAAMVSGGGLIVAEKVYQDSGFLESVINSAHYDFKRKYFSPEEIWNKQETLRSIMMPFSDADNIAMFKAAGFSATPIWQSLNFKAWLLLKD